MTESNLLVKNATGSPRGTSRSLLTKGQALNSRWALPQKYESHLDRVSTGSGSDLVQPSESKILREYCMPITDRVATAPCTDPIQQ